MTALQAFLQTQITTGLTIREISRQTGVAASTISRICNGGISPNMETAGRILRPFGYRMEINKIGREPVDLGGQDERLD